MFRFLFQAFSIVAVIGAVMAVHEWGHFITARLSGMFVEEFSIGFGPAIRTWKKDDCQYSVRLLPFFAYVRIAGMSLEDPDRPDGFNAKPIWARGITLAGGAIANMVFAAVLYCLVGSAFGLPVGVSSRIDAVMPGQPAAAAGLQSGDQIIGIDDKRTSDVVVIKKRIEAAVGHDVALLLSRAGKQVRIIVKPQLADVPFLGKGGKVTTKKVGRIGIVFALIIKRVGIVPAVKSGVLTTFDQTEEFAKGLTLLVLGKQKPQLAGPVGIARDIGSKAGQGLSAIPSLLLWTGMLSLNIGLLNLIPFPALDGGRLFFLLVEAIRGRHINRKREFVVHTVGLGVLLLMILVVTAHELVDLARDYILR